MLLSLYNESVLIRGPAHTDTRCSMVLGSLPGEETAIAALLAITTTPRTMLLAIPSTARQKSSNLIVGCGGLAVSPVLFVLSSSTRPISCRLSLSRAMLTVTQRCSPRRVGDCSSQHWGHRALVCSPCRMGQDENPRVSGPPLSASMGRHYGRIAVYLSGKRLDVTSTRECYRVC